MLYKLHVNYLRRNKNQPIYSSVSSAISYYFKCSVVLSSYGIYLLLSYLTVTVKHVVNVQKCSFPSERR